MKKLKLYDSKPEKRKEDLEPWKPEKYIPVGFENFAVTDGFIAQEKILKELDLFVEDIFDGTYHNFLFQAYSGYGKTVLAERMIRYLDADGEHSQLYIPTDGLIPFDKKKTIHFIDEAHQLKDVEQFYPLMLSGKYIFILATNEFDKLKEPLVNRCIPFVFEPYTLDDITKIIRPVFEKRGLGKLSDDWLYKFAGYGRNNPRISKTNALRIALLLNKDSDTITAENVFGVIKEYLNIERGGFNHYDRNYIECLEKCGGTASLALLESLMQVPKNIITKEVEPFLIGRGLLRISRTGRTLLRFEENPT